MNFPIKPKRSTDISQSADSVKEEVSNAYFVEVVKENYPMYLRKSYAYVKSHSIAEDAVQEGILTAHLNLSSVKSREAFPAWLYRIIVHKAIDLLHKKRKLVLIDDDFDELVSYDSYGLLNAPLWAEMLTPEEEIIKSESLEQVRIAVESLDDLYRIPILLKDFEEFSIREISEMLQISESNTKVRIHRARLKLKNELNDYFFPKYMEKSK